MVAPLPQEEPAPGVRVTRSSTGQFVGFQDLETGKFISRRDAADRLTYSVERGALIDSLGGAVGIGALSLPKRGVSVAHKIRESFYEPLDKPVETFRPGANQELIERLVMGKKDGTLETVEISHGLGQRYDEGKGGGRWRHKASEALGLAEGERLPTRDLKRAVLYREIIIRTIR